MFTIMIVDDNEQLQNEIGNLLLDNTLTVNITRIRNKIDEIGLKDYIKTKRGQGYIVWD